MDSLSTISSQLERGARGIESCLTLVAGLAACLVGGLCGCEADMDAGERESAVAVESQTEDGGSSNVVARVNDREIHDHEVEERLERIGQLYRHSRRSFDDEERAAKREKVVEQLIDRELLLDQINQRNLEIDTELVDEAVERRIDSEFGSPAAFRRYLDAQNITVGEFRGHIREELAIGELLSDEDVSIDEEQLREHYERIANRRPAGERVLVSSASIRLPDSRDEDQHRRLRSTIETMLDGVDSRSDLKGLGDEFGSDITLRLAPPRWFERDHLDGSTAHLLFEETAQEAVSPVVETPVGFEFYWVHEQRDAGMRNLDEVQDLLRERAQRGRLEKRRRQLVQELRDDASITINLPDHSDRDRD